MTSRFVTLLVPNQSLHRYSVDFDAAGAWRILCVFQRSGSAWTNGRGERHERVPEPAVGRETWQRGKPLGATARAVLQAAGVKGA